MSAWGFDELDDDGVGDFTQEDLEIYRELALEADDGVQTAARDRRARSQTHVPSFAPLERLDNPQSAAEPHIYRTREPLFDLFGDTHSSNNSDSQEFVTLEDSDSDSSMPPATRRRGAAARRASVVDLTDAATSAEASASTSRPSRTRKRSADDSNAGEGRAPKRRRSIPENIEELDLTGDVPSAEDELLQVQQQETIKAQQAAEESSGPQRIGSRQCIICMENYTNCTATSCGHFYCHECLVRALMAAAKSSDRGTGTCPVCRKPLSHTNKKKTDVIPMSFMTKAEFDRQKRIRGA